MLRNSVAAVLVLSCLGSAALAEGDAVKGETVFKRCMACHAIDDMSIKTGPSLKGVYGRVAGSFEGYSYSEDLAKMKADGKVWDDALLDQYLTNPKAVAPKGKMSFGGLKKPEDRLDLIAFLKSKSQ